MLLLYIVGLTQVAKAEGGGARAAWPLAAVLAASATGSAGSNSVWFALLLVAFAAWVRARCGSCARGGGSAPAW